MVNFRKVCFPKTISRLKVNRSMHVYDISVLLSCAFLLPCYCRYFEKNFHSNARVFHYFGYTWPIARRAFI